MAQTFEQHHKSTIPGTPVIGVPVQRRRQPMEKVINEGPTEAQQEEHAKRQREAARIHDLNIKRQQKAGEPQPPRTDNGHEGKPEQPAAPPPSGGTEPLGTPPKPKPVKPPKK